MAMVFEMRSDFVSTVTHELKTPVQVIRSIGETISRGRVSSGERLQEYAQLLVQEGHRLSRLIENLLPTRASPMSPSCIRSSRRIRVRSSLKRSEDFIGSSLMAASRYRSMCRKNDLGFSPIGPQLSWQWTTSSTTRCAIPVPPVHWTFGYRRAMARLTSPVRDQGEGIAEDELGRVQQRFTRGRSHHGHGSGLGLAIVNRIVSDHGGTLRLESVKGTGTIATISLPAVRG